MDTRSVGLRERQLQVQVKKVKDEKIFGLFLKMKECELEVDFKNCEAEYHFFVGNSCQAGCSHQQNYVFITRN